MSYPMALPPRTARPRWRRRVVVRAAVAAARVLALLPPARLRLVLGVLRRGAPAASAGQARGWYHEVVACSPRCAGWRGCLPRSLGICLLARAEGVWPRWCVGVVATPPFAAHAWVEADGEVIGDPGTPAHYRPLIAVDPAGTTDAVPEHR